MTPYPQLPGELNLLIQNYRFVKDTIGMSPAGVYKLLGDGGNLYLKVSTSEFHGTTYDVQREKDVLLWLEGKLPVPQVLAYTEDERGHYLLTREAWGVLACEDDQNQRDPQRMVRLYSEGIRRLQAVSLQGCPFDNSIENRLRELEYLLQHGLADVERDNWEPETPFAGPQDLYAHLQKNKPPEELVFSHGDFGDSNFFVRDGHISAWIDLGRGGRAGRWQDIALCVRSIRQDLGAGYLDLFFDLLEMEPDWDKIGYYILLDEMF